MSYIFTDEVMVTIVVGLLVSLLGYLVIVLIFFGRAAKGELLHSFLLLFGVGIMGASVGEISGLSRTGVAGTVIPALLTLVGGFSVYTFGQQKAESPIVNIALIVFVFSCFLSYNQSSVVRSKHQELEFCRKQYTDAARSNVAGAIKNLDHMIGPYCAKVLREFQQSDAN